VDAIQELLKAVQDGQQVTHEMVVQLRESTDQKLAELPSLEAFMEKMAPEVKRLIEENAAAQAAAPNQGSPAHPFKDFGDFCSKVMSGSVPSDYRMAQTTATTAGGYLVPDEFKAQILEIAMEGAIVRPRATVIPMATDTLKMPAWNQDSHATNFYGGALGYWVAEGNAITATDTAVKEVSLGVNALAALNYQSIRLLKASPMGVAGLLEKSFGNVIRFMEDQSFIDGTGTTHPQGVIGSGCEVAVTRAGAGAIATADVIGMYARFLGATSNAVWICNQTTIPQLFGMADANSNNLWAPSLVPGVPGTLLGIPVVFSEKASALGTKGDLILADFNYYLIGDLGGMEIDYSEHVRFANLEGAMRLYKFVDGKPWMSTTYTPRKGTALSPFVVLN
jgi:HK97 family phage major capsid protein